MKQTRFFLLIMIAFISFSAGSLHSQGIIESQFNKGNELYLDNEFIQAIEVYTSILNSGYESGELYYNLGNAHFKAGNLGKTILYYEKAKKFLPNDRDLKDNLALANLRVADQINVPRLAIWEIVDNILDYFTLQAYYRISLALFLLLLAAAAVYYFLPKGNLKRTMFFTSVPAFSLFMIVLSVFIWKLWFEVNFKEGVIIVDEVEVVSAPEENAKGLFSLHEGVKVRVTQELHTFIKIELPDGKTGWVENTSTHKI